MNSNQTGFNTPILFIIFNRLETTRLVFEKIKEIRPKKLYISCDGPRSYINREIDIVIDVRKYVLSQIDWKCDVFTLFHDENLGCGNSVSKAIKWFFSNECNGIVLEDDCLPDINFFTYCEMGLKKYEFSSNVYMIAGFNPFGNSIESNSSFFSENPSVWGWATWSNRLLNYDFEIRQWPNNLFVKYLKDKFPLKIYEYYVQVFNDVSQKKIDTWDYQLTYLILSNNGLTLKPKSNLIKNIGTEGAHTISQDHNHFVPYGNIVLNDHVFPELFIPDLNEDDKFYERFNKKNINLFKTIKKIILNKFKNVIKNFYFRYFTNKNFIKDK
jgi:hypothetical protein